ncbi:MAG: response regulator transcription factor [Ruminococcus sp.]|jgi:two-component system response regulator AgrA|nr:response regulator transcription factor [Ruminococcus sp.]
MVDIYICEDNQKQLNLFKKYISNTIVIENMDMKIALATSDPHELFRKISAAENTGLFFLDIDLKSDINGLELAQRIRRIQPRCFIIFITSHSEMSFLTFQYKVEALDFIIKDTPEHIKSKIHECLLDVEHKYTSMNNAVNRTFVIRQNDRSITIDYADIICFETSSNIHKILLHAKKRVIEFTGQLKEIEEQLDGRFYRCHRSYIINVDHISEVDFTKLVVYMNNGESCPVSVRLKKGLKKIMNADGH